MNNSHIENKDLEDDSVKSDRWRSIQRYTEDSAFSEVDNEADTFAVHDAMQVAFDNTEIGLERVLQIVHNMTIASEPNTVQGRSFDINACVKDITQKLSKQFSVNINITLDLADMPNFFIDGYKITQLLTNLIANASEAIECGGEITVTTVNNGNYIEVSVSDNGCGIEQHLHEIIFDPCYTTRKEAEETGLGLAISRDIAHEHGGNLRVSSRLDQGSVFTLQLPVSSIIIH